MGFKLIVFLKLGVERTELGLSPKRNAFERPFLSGEGECGESTSRRVAGNEVPRGAVRYPGPRNHSRSPQRGRFQACQGISARLVCLRWSHTVLFQDRRQAAFHLLVDSIGRAHSMPNGDDSSLAEY